MTDIKPVKSFLERDNVKKRFHDLLWKRAWSFLTSVMGAVSANKQLADADPMSIYTSSLVAATLDLPINPNLGFAYIVPYKGKAQFQMGYKWFIQLAQRSGLFKTISATPVYEWQIVSEDPLQWFEFDWKAKKSDNIVWYASYFKLLNWFEKTLYMTIEELKQHGIKFSASYKRGYGLWKDDFDSMAIKTVLKLILSKYAPLSVEMQTAVTTDQWIIKDEEFQDVEYIDNPPTLWDTENEVDQELLDHWKEDIQACKTIEELKQLKKQNKPTDKTILSLFEEHEKAIQDQSISAGEDNDKPKK